MDLDSLLESCGAVLKGHFLLTSGRHSDLYIEKFRLLERPDLLTALCARIAERFKGERIDLVAGPTTGGIIVAFEVARQMGLPALYIESEQGAKRIRRGATISQGARVLVVDDVLTTGTSVLEVIELIESQGAKVAGGGVLIDRSEQELKLGAQLFAVHRVEASSFAANEVPAWLGEIPVSKPGSRPLTTN